VSALGHYLEGEGIATVAISSVRPQTENVRPPRALWVPLELGRPFGPPSDPAFQTKVIMIALRLLEIRTAPVVLQDFPYDDPREGPDPGWHPPPSTTASAGVSGDLATVLESEISMLESSYAQSVAQRRRTIVGLSGLSIKEAGRYVAAWLRGEIPSSPTAGMSAPLALRFAAYDLKAYYIEAALIGPAKPSSKQIGDWFWDETAAGRAIVNLRQTHLASSDDRLKAIAGLFLVPGVRVPPTG
jgi:hypothetical protein